MSNQSDHRLWVKAFSKPSLRTILVVPFVLQILAVVGIAGYLAYRNGQKTVEDLANQVMEEVSERISDRLDTYLQNPQNIVAANNFAVKQGTLKITDFEQLRQQFWQQISLNPSLASSAFWSEQGQMIGYGRIVSPEEREAVRQLIGKDIPVGTTYLLEVSKTNLGQQQFYDVDSQGKPKKLLYQFAHNFRQLPWYRQVKPTKKQSWLPIFINRVTDVLVIQSFAPVHNAKVEFKGVFTSTYLLSEISTFLNKLQFSPSGQAFIIERSGNLVATSIREIPQIKDAQGQSTRLAANNSQDNLTREIVQQLTQKFGSFRDLKTNQQLRLVSNKQTQFVRLVPYQDQYGVDWLIVVAVPESDFMAQINANTRNTILLCLGAVGLAIAFGTFTATKITRPLQQLSQASQALAAGEIDSQIPDQIQIKELDVISVSFNQMAQQLQESFHRVRNTLEASKERYTTIFRNSPDPITITDLVNGRFIEVNEAFLHLTGYSRAEVIGRTAAELNLIVNPDEAAEIVQQLQAKNRINNYEFNWRIKSGEVKTSLVSSELIELDGQNFVLTISKEIGELKRVETQLRQALQELTSTEAKLIESKRLIEQVTEFSSALLYIFDLIEQRNVYINTPMARLLGYSVQEIQAMGSNLFSLLVHPEDLPKVIETTMRCTSLLDGESIESEYRMRDTQGNWHWLYNRASVLSRTASGQPKQILGAAIDLTERKQLEIALQEKTAQLDCFFSAALDLLCIADTNGYFLRLSAEWERSLGYTVADLEGRRFLDFVHPDDLELTLSVISDLSNQQEVLNFTNRYQHRDGSYRWLEWRSLPVGNLIYATARDISDRKLAEAALIESENRLAEAQRIACLGSWEFDVVNKVITWSDELFHIFGFDSSQPSPTFAEYLQKIHPDDRADVQQKIDTAIAIGKSYTVEHRIMIADGICRYLFGRGEAILNHQGQVIKLFGTAMDITERKQAELEIQRAKEAAEAANHAKSTFLSHMSHELRTPLNIILGFTQLMARSDTLSPEHLKNIKIINRSGEHLLTLINDVLDMAKIESGSVTLNEKNFNLYQLLDELETMFRLKANDKGLELMVDRSANVPEFVRTDDIKLRQVLINLVNNALKFTQQGSISIQVYLADDRDRNSDKSRLNFVIADTGAGIPSDELEKIFEPFKQTSVGKTAKEGTGLGLTISQKFINLMGGKITVSSEVGRGSIFKFDIQVSIPEQTPTKPTQKSTQKVIGVASNQPQYRILIADDTIINRLLLSRVISQLGLEIKEASNGKEVLEIWSQWQPHLIFMDIQMPVMDGVEATKKIRVKEQQSWQLKQINNPQVSLHKTVIVALTASIFEEEKIAIMLAGCDDFISKPFQLENIIDCLSEHLQLAYIYENP